MAAQPPTYPADPSAGYPPQPQPGYPAGYAGQGYGYDPNAAQGYPAQGYAQPPAADTKPGVDAYGQPIAGGYPPQQQAGYPQQPPGYQPYPTQAAPPPGYTAQQSAQTTVVVAHQPAVVTQVTPGIRPNNYLVLSIVNLLFCFFILGLIALVFSLQVDSNWTSGNYEEARRNSNIAKILNFIGIGLGIGGWVVVGIYVLAQIIISVAITAS